MMKDCDPLSLLYILGTCCFSARVPQRKPFAYRTKRGLLNGSHYLLSFQPRDTRLKVTTVHNRQMPPVEGAQVREGLTLISGGKE